MVKELKRGVGAPTRAADLRCALHRRAPHAQHEHGGCWNTTRHPRARAEVALNPPPPFTATALVVNVLAEARYGRLDCMSFAVHPPAGSDHG